MQMNKAKIFIIGSIVIIGFAFFINEWLHQTGVHRSAFGWVQIPLMFNAIIIVPVVMRKKLDDESRVVLLWKIIKVAIGLFLFSVIFLHLIQAQDWKLEGLLSFAGLLLLFLLLLSPIILVDKKRAKKGKLKLYSNYIIPPFIMIFVVVCGFYGLVLCYQSSVDLMNQIRTQERVSGLYTIIQDQDERIVELGNLIENQAQLIADYQQELATVQAELLSLNADFTQRLDALALDLQWERHLRILETSPFSTYLTIDEGFSIERTFETSTESFDLTMYRMIPLESSGDLFHQEENGYWEIIILQDEIFRDVIRHYPRITSTSFFINPYELSIMEVDVDFDGHSDLLIWLGAFGNQGASMYDAFLQRDDEFVHTPSFANNIMNPMINYENQSISAHWRSGAASHGRESHRFIDGEFVMVARLSRRGYARFLTYTESILINDQWQENLLCIVNENEEIDSEYLEQCVANWHEDLYHRIYDEHGYWHFNNRGIGLWELDDN